VSSPDVAAAAAEGPATPAALPPSSAKQGPILHQPYSHILWCNIRFLPGGSLYISNALCTDIHKLQIGVCSCSVQVSFVKHPADWDVKGYILQHPVMQQQAAIQAPAGSNTQSLRPYKVTLKCTAKGLWLHEVPVYSIFQSLDCGGAPHAVVLQERVRCCTAYPEKLGIKFWAALQDICSTDSTNATLSQ
jgi:hypothetical protein